MTEGQPSARIIDPRAVRVVAIGHGSLRAGAPIVLEPAAVPIAPAPRIAGSGALGGIATQYPPLEPVSDGPDGPVLVDGVPLDARLERQDDLHAVLVERDGGDPIRTPVLTLPLQPITGPSLVVRREVVVGGWSIEVEIESERRASLRERARRGREETAHRGPTEVRAIIPGRVIAVSVVPGDAVVAGQQLLVVEAMKMQNELRAPRDGEVSKVAVGTGQTIEVGDLLLVLQ
ncbi:MAG: acetyl-CoA carboxylase biotin carboxyl carrier protein subunit [Chloroflexota bacterium]